MRYPSLRENTTRRRTVTVGYTRTRTRNSATRLCTRLRSSFAAFPGLDLRPSPTTTLWALRDRKYERHVERL